MVDQKQLTRIKGLSEVRRLPRIGKIRLGIKKKSSSGKEYPAEVPYFVCPPEVEAVYGKTPTSIDVMFPTEDETVFFSQAYKWYSASHLKCKGNGEVALRRVGDLSDQQKKDLGDDLPKDQNDLVEIPCPCPLLDQAGGCSQHGGLMVLLPKVSMGGVYQIVTGSFHNIVNLNSAIDYTRALVGRIALVPLILRRIPTDVEYQGKKAKHYLLSLEFPGNINAINRLRQDNRIVLERLDGVGLPAPEPVAALPAPAPVDVAPVPAEPSDVSPADTESPANPVVEGQAPTEITVLKAEKTDQGYTITASGGVIYYTDRRDIAVAAWEAQKAKRSLKAFVGEEDGVPFITGVAAAK